MSNFCFVVGPDEAGRHGVLQVCLLNTFTLHSPLILRQQISIPKHLATVFGLQNRSEVTLTKVSRNPKIEPDHP